jgi:hypothetical protein
MPSEYNALNTVGEALDGSRGPDQQRIARVGLDWLTTLLAKNQDYGGSAWAVPALCPKLQTGDAILVRMSDKISRINNLLRADNKALVDESIEDTIKDLGAYCLLWLARPKDQPVQPRAPVSSNSMSVFLDKMLPEEGGDP